jgi:hypothetical protein
MMKKILRQRTRKWERTRIEERPRKRTRMIRNRKWKSG